MTLSDAVAVSLVLAQGVLIAVSVIFLLSGLDDLFIDVCFFGRRLFRRCFVEPKYPKLSEEQLLARAEQAVAIMIPAWDESAVIRPMLLNTLRALNYSNYHIFVGTYPNDTATQVEVEKVREQSDRVHRVVTRDDGPTNKADCLNWIYQGIRLFEKESSVRFEIFVMQDCEDVIHRLAYKVFNYLIPRKDMVQLPVLSLDRHWHQFTAGHYIDEFAQLHYKDLIVREMLSGCVPAAGVGCAFSRRALERVGQENNNQVFSTDSLTEDYDFGLRLKHAGLAQAFVRLDFPRVEARTSWLTGATRQVKVSDVVCIREYFPANYRASVRQKARWVVGITLQGWQHIGWQGDLWTRYMLFRDRKSLITNFVNVLGYLVVLAVLSLWTVNWIAPDSYRYPSVLEEGSWVWYCILANAWLFGLRIFMRGYCTYRLYDVRQALLAVPRMVWGNFINFMATARAVKLYSTYLRTGKPIGWDKTAHVYPSEEELRGQRRKLGDLLLERGLVTIEQLNEALRRQKEAKTVIGAVLREMGVLSEGDLRQALHAQ
jgi:adsorption protein B